MSWETIEERRKYHREWRKRKVEKDPNFNKRNDLKSMYGVTLEWYRQKLEEQQNRCAICGREEVMVIKGSRVLLAVDHDHATGKVRGLLCTRCNRGMGLLADNKEILMKAISYLASYDEVAS